MRNPRPIPPHLTGRPFSHREAIAAGITPRMLQHPRFVQLYPRVYCLDGTELDDLDWIEAARMSMPERAQPSHLTRLRLAGLEYGELLPMHFTIEGDLHLVSDDIRLHRTVKMPPCDDQGVSLSAAFIGAAAQLRLIDMIKIGDWLMYRDLLNPAIVSYLAYRDTWRHGSAAALTVLPHLDAKSRSLKESEVRALILACGLPSPEVNADIVENDEFIACGDLVYRDWRWIVEYEGRQHAFDIRQFNRDIDRYASLRRHGWTYLQVTQEMLARPKSLMERVHRELAERGYGGPPPVFGGAWDALFAPVNPARPPRQSVDVQPHSA